MNKLKLVCFLCLLLMYFPSNAHAYIDPGIGSMILQGLAASLITAMIFFKDLPGKISSFFRKKTSGNEREKNNDLLQ